MIFFWNFEINSLWGNVIVSVTSDIKVGTWLGGVAIVENSASPLENEKAQYAMAGIFKSWSTIARAHSL